VRQRGANLYVPVIDRRHIGIQRRHRVASMALHVASEVIPVTSIDDSVTWRRHPVDRTRHHGARLASSGDFMRRLVDKVVDDNATPVNYGLGLHDDPFQ
jgi:hypothetical protein